MTLGDDSSCPRSQAWKTSYRACTLRAQLAWCRKEGVPRAIITHCGSEIVTADERKLTAKLRAVATEPGLEARIAYDGMEVILRIKLVRG
jgi:hypothetical protein